VNKKTEIKEKRNEEEGGSEPSSSFFIAGEIEYSG
jgi:hypothetical protein